MDYEERLAAVEEILSSISSDAASDVDNGELDPDIYEAIAGAARAVFKAQMTAAGRPDLVEET